MKTVLFWTPRILSICFALFLGLFAMDAFVEGQSLWRSIVGFIIHLVPSFIVILALIFSWKNEWLGFLFFVLLAAAYIVMARGKFPFLTYVIISGPLFVIGILFLAHWFVAKRSVD